MHTSADQFIDPTVAFRTTSLSTFKSLAGPKNCFDKVDLPGLSSELARRVPEPVTVLS
jgi:hypothetical protein